MGSVLNTLKYMCCSCCSKKTEKNNSFSDRSLSTELLEEYKSQNISIEMDKVKTLHELRIKSASFIRERSCMPHELYEKISQIGEGSYGKLIKVKPLYLNEFRAMKIIKKSHSYFNVTEEDVYREIKILKSLDHPNIIKIHEFFVDSVNFYIVNEYCEEGDLYNKISNISYFTEKVVLNIMKQIFSAVAYLHSKAIIHGDLKLENILIDSRGYTNTNVNNLKSSKTFEEYFDIKLIDFGCSKIFTKDKKYSDVTGTYLYMAPEVIDNAYDEKSDLWSCGVIMYILLCGKAPFPGYDEEEIINNIKKLNVEFRHSPFSNVSDNSKDLIKQLLNKDSNKRVSARQALKHPWFKKNVTDELNIIDLNYSQTVLQNLKNFNAEQKFQQAVLTYITHNLIQKTEIQKLRKMFKVLDKDVDGRISKIELKDAFRDILGTVLADIELENIFKSIDHDKNGYIEYEEFLRATLDKNLLLSESNLNLAFNIFDIDHNGRISVDEIKLIIGGGKSIPDTVIVELLAEIDKTEDEEITFDEFKEIMNKIVK